MALRRQILINTVSGLAVLGAAAPALAQTNSTAVQEIVVPGIRQSLEKAIEVKKLATNQVDAISSTDIGKLPDKNIADALQRLPGINTQSAASGEGGFDENDRVSIRGTSPSLTEVMIDGHNVSTGDWFILDQFQTVGRSISFELLPSEVTQGISVYKTQDASILEGGVAGAVDIQTRKPLSLGKTWTLEASVQGQYNTNTKSTRPQFNGLLGWQAPSGAFGVVLQGFDEQRSVERLGQETLGYTGISASMPIAKGHPELIGVQAPTLIGSTLFKQEKERTGGFGAAEWRPNDKIELNLTGFYSKLTASNSNNNYMYWGSNELNNNTPTAYTVANNTLTSATWPAGPNGLVIDNLERPGSQSQSYYVNLDGKWSVNDHLTLKGQIGFTEGRGETLGAPSFEVDGAAAGISYAPAGNGWTVRPVAGGGYAGPQSAAGLSNDWAWNEEFRSVDKEVYGKFDGQWDLAGDGPIKNVKFGARFADHNRQVDGWDRGCTLGANGQCWTSPTMPYAVVAPGPYPSNFTASNLGIPGLLVPGAGAGSSKAIQAVLNGIADGVHGPLSSIVTPQNYYWMGAFKVSELDSSGYLMADLGGPGWRGNVGVRVVNTRETPHANVSDPAGTHAGDIKSSAFGDYYVTDTTYNYLDILPSANLTFDLKPNVLLRLSAGQQISRPDFSALGGTVSLTDLTLTGNGGNSTLKPVKAAVYDAALEWYYRPTAVAAISLFHDDFSSYVTYSTSTQLYRDQLLAGSNGGVAPYQPYVISSPTNTTAELSGVELQVQQPLAMGFGFQANATWVDGHEANGNALVGTSKYTFNAVGYYEGHGASLRLAYTYRSNFFVGLDRSSIENQDGYGTLDASASYQLTPNLSLTLDALNVTNSLLKYYAANRTQVRAVYDNGTQLYAGIRLKF